MHLRVHGRAVVRVPHVRHPGVTWSAAQVKRITQKLRWVEKQAKEAAVRRAQQAVQAAAARVAAVQREVDQAQAPLT